MPLLPRVTPGKPNPTERNEDNEEREGWIPLIIILLSTEGEHPNATDLIRLSRSQPGLRTLSPRGEARSNAEDALWSTIQLTEMFDTREVR